MKVSVLSPSLSNNCLGRAFILAKVLARHYDVEILGPAHDGYIWGPCDTGEIPIRPLGGISKGALWSAIAPALRAIEGDVIYAIKPLLLSYGLAVAKRVTSKTPVVLDIDDWQLGFTTQASGRFDVRRAITRIRGLAVSPNSYYWVAMMEKLIPWADDITTVSSFLNDRFGGRGAIVPHGRDAAVFDPALYDRAALRREHGLDRFEVIMFLGTPRPHKGIDDIIEAAKRLDRDNLRIVIIGGQGEPYVERLRRENDRLVIALGMVPFSDIPKYVLMADLVALPQKRDPKTVGQIPAKLIDAMAMARPIVATAVSDVPDMLRGCGIVVEPDDHEALAAEIERLLGDPALARRLGEQAREKFLAAYTFDVMEAELLETFAKYADRAGSASRVAPSTS